ncbi:MAG: hypothetical protein ABI978_06040 [Chloroflexota bacterium]
MALRTESGVSQGGSSVDVLADELERRGIGAPAAILLDAHRPLLPLIRQGAIVLGPLLNSLLGPRRTGQLRRALDEPAYDLLATRLRRDRPDDQD